MAVRWNSDAVVARTRRAIQRGIVRGTEALRSEVLTQILNTAKTGRVYARRGLEHQASAPGEPPASDTGVLVRSIRSDFSRLDDNVGRVVVGAAYGPHLEYGTQTMEPRPFLRPAVANQRANVERIVVDEVVRELGRRG